MIPRSGGPVDVALVRAADPATPGDVLAVLAGSGRNEVRAAAVANPSCPPDAVAAAARGACASPVRWAALRNPVCPPGTLVRVARLAGTCLRIDLAEAVAANPAVPFDALVALAQAQWGDRIRVIGLSALGLPVDPGAWGPLVARPWRTVDPRIASAVAALSGDPGTLRRVAGHPDPGVRARVAGNPAAPADVLAVLVGDPVAAGPITARILAAVG